MAYSDLVWQFLRDLKKQERDGDPYERFYHYAIDQGLTIEQAESETATFMETVADLMD